MLWLFNKRTSPTVEKIGINVTDEFRNTFSAIENSSSNFFITGNAGTGKTTFIRYFRDNTNKRVVVLAPTGIAALNVRGQTIHSFFHIPPRVVTKDVILDIKTNDRVFKMLDTLIIDEASMVRADLFDGIDILMREKGRDRNLPFGGIQIVLVGDLFQLPPVVTTEEEPIIRSRYQTPFFFSTEAYQNGQFKTLELKEIHRQSDPHFIGILNAVRHGKGNLQVLEPINNQIAPPFASGKEKPPIILTTTNRVADAINQSELRSLPEPEYEYRAEVEGSFPEEKDTIVPRSLQLRKGARVMIIKNSGKFINGDIGTVIQLDALSIRVRLDSSGEEFIIGKEVWENIRYRVEAQSNKLVAEVIGRIKQFPVRLAWAITIHKSQGLTFDKVTIDFTRSPFAGGQTYVALSRCRTLQGLMVSKEIYPNDVWVNEHIVEFVNGNVS